jgi:hypothetical protein
MNDGKNYRLIILIVSLSTAGGGESHAKPIGWHGFAPVTLVNVIQSESTSQNIIDKCNYRQDSFRNAQGKAPLHSLTRGVINT